MDRRSPGSGPAFECGRILRIRRFQSVRYCTGLLRRSGREIAPRTYAGGTCGAGAHIDAFYFCPHHPEGTIKSLAVSCRCRKPAPGMLEQAAREWSIDLGASFLIGDKDDDVAAAKAFNIRGVKFNFRRGCLRTWFVVKSPATRKIRARHKSYGPHAELSIGTAATAEAAGAVSQTRCCHHCIRPEDQFHKFLDGIYIIVVDHVRILAFGPSGWELPSPSPAFCSPSGRASTSAATGAAPSPLSRATS